MADELPPGGPSPAPPRGKTPPKAPALIAAAVLVAIPLATQFEGFRGKAYLDPAHIPTQCDGETEGVDPSRIYSRDECAAKLRDRMARDYAPPILKCLPQLDMEHRYVFGALLDASYNAGPAAVCKSRMAVSIRAGDWPGACHGLLGWYTTARDRKTGVRRELPGLVTRRQAEARTCSTVPPAAPVVAIAPSPSSAAPAAPVPAPAVQPAPPPRLTLWQRIERFFGREP